MLTDYAEQDVIAAITKRIDNVLVFSLLRVIESQQKTVESEQETTKQMMADARFRATDINKGGLKRI